MILVLGVGNEYRHDDAAGRVAARLVGAWHLPDVQVMEMDGGGALLLEAWRGKDTVILLDAVSSDAPPGTIHRFDGTDHKVPARFFNHSSHGFGVPEAIEMGRALGELPSRLVLYGIEGKDWSSGTGLSKEVEAAVPCLAARVEEALTLLKITLAQ